MPKALQKPPPHPPVGPTEPHGTSPTHMRDMRKRLGSRRDNLVRGDFLTARRWSGEGHCKGRAEPMGKKRPGNDNSGVLQLAHELTLTVCVL